MRRLASAACIVSVLAGGALPSGALEAKKPSELVTLRTSGAACTASPGTRRLDQRVLPDGTTTPFTMPPGRVLVVTGAEWVGDDSDVIESMQLALYVETAAPLPTPFFVDGVTAGPVSFFFHTSVVPQAVVAGPGPLCAFSGLLLDTFVVNVHGFLAKDR
jgi:hypothetical protein